MLYAQKANVVTVIKDEEIDKFVSNGYKVMDESGKIIRDVVPDNLKALREAYTAHTAEINSLKAQIVRLREELDRAKDILSQKEVATTEAKPKATRAKRTTKAE